MADYRQDFLLHCIEDIKPLAAREWDEVVGDDKMDVDWDAFIRAEEAGVLKLFLARDGQTVVGYLAALLTVSFTRAAERVASVEAFYVLPERRAAGVGARLLAFSEACLRDDGVSRVIANSSLAKPVDSFLRVAGYTPTDTRYERVL
jgi:GNAT superfamily N-acetyltransferase